MNTQLELFETPASFKPFGVGYDTGWKQVRGMARGSTYLAWERKIVCHSDSMKLAYLMAVEEKRAWKGQIFSLTISGNLMTLYKAEDSSG